jgi:anti-anti-sigma regulatory factor
MTVKIERTFGGRDMRIRLSGQLRAEQLSQVKSEVERAGQPVVLDLEEVDLVDIDGVRFLNECESAGIPVLQCSPYVREWMVRERNRPESAPGK